MGYVIFLLVALIFLREVMHGMERKDLYNRIMARDLGEYKALKPRKIKNSIMANIKKRRNENRNEG
jgi:hypothetical protein